MNVYAKRSYASAILPRIDLCRLNAVAATKAIIGEI
jgi:hypothetical protein